MEQIRKKLCLCFFSKVFNVYQPLSLSLPGELNEITGLADLSSVVAYQITLMF